jgi:hypothetical protein
MTIDEIKKECSKELNALILKAFRIGKQEGIEEGKQSVDRYSEGYTEGATELKWAMCDKDFIKLYYSQYENAEDILEQNIAEDILDDFHEHLNSKPGRYEDCKKDLHEMFEDLKEKYGEEAVKKALDESEQTDAKEKLE